MTDAPPLPAAATPFSPSAPPRRLRWLPWAAGVLVLVVAVVAVVTLVSRSTTKASTPASATAAYYGALHRNDANAAYALLCPQRRQAQTREAYAASVAQDTASGTGIRSWRQGGTIQVQGAGALVPGTLVLDDGLSTPIQILLLKVGGDWRVCSSNLGGILPGPGPGASGGSGGVDT